MKLDMKRAGVTALALLFTTPLAAQERPSVAPKNMQEIAPQLADYTDRILFGDVWLRPELAPRDRSLVVLSVLITTGKTAQMVGHLNRGLANGIKPIEVSGLVTHLAFYAGWPNAVSALTVIEQVFAERKLDLAALRAGISRLPARSGHATDTAAPTSKFSALTTDVIFGDLWKRTDLAPRDRSLVTIAALAANGDTGQLSEYVQRGLENGLTCLEIKEALTHLAFYAGWPRANAAIDVAGKVFSGGKRASSVGLQHVPPGQSPVAGPASNFTGSATVTSPFAGTGNAQLSGATVTFQPGARTNWHSHPFGQLLIVTEGRGLVQTEGEPAREMKSGDVVWTGPGVKHWHGATRTNAMSHVSITEIAEGKAVTWLAPVADEHYNARQ